MAAQSSTATLQHPTTSKPSFIQRMNGARHELWLRIFMVVVLAHWAEHLAQAFQIYVMDWPIPESRGVLGLWFPWLISSETLHYGYNITMLVLLWLLRSGFTGTSHTWWMIAFWIQFWHHIEHAMLQGQAIAGQNLFNSPVPVSFVQLWVPRVELHLIYNTVVFIPMVVAMYMHMVPSPEERARMTCTCAIKPRTATT